MFGIILAKLCAQLDAHQKSYAKWDEITKNHNLCIYNLYVRHTAASDNLINDYKHQVVLRKFLVHYVKEWFVPFKERN